MELTEEGVREVLAHLYDNAYLGQHPLLPVLVCSVVNEPELALTLGAMALLKKPVSREQLLNAVAAIVGI